jgi:hypothetical protein
MRRWLWRANASARSTLRYPPNATRSSSRPNMPKEARGPQLVKAATTAVISILRFPKTPPANTSERQCASDWRSVPRGRPRGRCGTAAVLARAKSASAFQGLDQRVPWRSTAARRSKTLDEVRASLRRISRPWLAGRGPSLSACAHAVALSSCGSSARDSSEAQQWGAQHRWLGQ